MTGLAQSIVKKLSNKPKESLAPFDSKVWSNYMGGIEDTPKNVPFPSTIKPPHVGSYDTVIVRSGPDPRTYIQAECEKCQSLLQTNKFTEGTVYFFYYCPICQSISKTKYAEVRRIGLSELK